MIFVTCPSCGAQLMARGGSALLTCPNCGVSSATTDAAKATMAHSAQYPWARDLYLAFHTQADNFNAQLMRLFAKADGFNRRKLAKGYPDAALVFEAWHSSPTEAAFMARYRVAETLDPEGRERFLQLFPAPAPVVS